MRPTLIHNLYKVQSIITKIKFTFVEAPGNNSHTSLFKKNQSVIFVLKKDNHGKVIPVQTMTFASKDDIEHLAEKQLIEFAQIHVEKCTELQDAEKEFY